MSENQDIGEVNFQYYIDFALEDKIPWNEFISLMEALTPSLPKSKKLISLLLKVIKNFKEHKCEREEVNVEPSNDANNDEMPSNSQIDENFSPKITQIFGSSKNNDEMYENTCGSCGAVYQTREQLSEHSLKHQLQATENQLAVDNIDEIHENFENKRPTTMVGESCPISTKSIDGSLQDIKIEIQDDLVNLEQNIVETTPLAPLVQDQEEEKSTVVQDDKIKRKMFKCVSYGETFIKLSSVKNHEFQEQGLQNVRKRKSRNSKRIKKRKNDQLPYYKHYVDTNDAYDLVNEPPTKVKKVETLAVDPMKYTFEDEFQSSDIKNDKIKIIIGDTPEQLTEVLEQVEVPSSIDEKIQTKVEPKPKDHDYDRRIVNDHHIEKKKYKCDFCDETFSQKYERYTHYRRVHK